MICFVARTKGKEAKHMDKQTWTRCIDLSLTWNRCDVAQQELFNDENRSQWKVVFIKLSFISYVRTGLRVLTGPRGLAHIVVGIIILCT